MGEKRNLFEIVDNELFETTTVQDSRAQLTMSSYLKLTQLPVKVDLQGISYMMLEQCMLTFASGVFPSASHTPSLALLAHSHWVTSLKPRTHA